MTTKKKLMEEVQYLLEDYERRCELMYDDMVGDFAGRHELTDEAADRLFEATAEGK